MEQKLTEASLNELYQPLEMKAVQMLYGVSHRIFNPHLHYYSGCYTKGTDGSFSCNSYPIPVVTVDGYCDIEIHIDQTITVSTKMKRDHVLQYSFAKLKQYSFDAYDASDRNIILYSYGMTLEELKENAARCDGEEIGFSFYFDFDVGGDAMYEFVKLLRREGFYL